MAAYKYCISDPPSDTATCGSLHLQPCLTNRAITLASCLAGPSRGAEQTLPTAMEVATARRHRLCSRCRIPSSHSLLNSHTISGSHTSPGSHTLADRHTMRNRHSRPSSLTMSSSRSSLRQVPCLMCSSHRIRSTAPIQGHRDMVRVARAQTSPPR